MWLPYLVGKVKNGVHVRCLKIHVPYIRYLSLLLECRQIGDQDVFLNPLKPADSQKLTIHQICIYVGIRRFEIILFL